MWFLRLLNPLGSVAKSLAEAYAKKQNAQTDQAAIEADAEIAQLEARRAVLIAEQGSWRTSWIRPAIAAPVVIFLWKVLVWDIVLKLGVTDNPSPQVWYVITAVVSCYLLARGWEKR